ncbi:MAG: TonB family protein [Myxococcota bacterium]
MLVPLSLLGIARAGQPTLPVLESYVPAAYPEEALERAVEGYVVLSLTIDEEGFVVDVQLVGAAGNGFDAPAVESARTMRFRPATDDEGRPVASIITYNYTFDMDQVTPLSVAGVVREQGQKKVLANALIKAVGPDETLARTRSDDEGHFRFAGLADGKWVLTVTGEGLLPSSTGVDVPPDGYVEGLVLQAEKVPEWQQYEAEEFIEVTAELKADPAEFELGHDLVVTLPGSLGDPVRALQNLPGIARAPFGSGQLQVRGTDPEDTAYLIDGARIPIAFHFTAVSTVVAADLLSSVKFFPGAWSTRYGRAIGGVVDLETNDDLPKRSDTNASFDIFQATGYTRQRLGQKTAVTLSARRSYIDALAQPVLAASGAEDLRVPRYYDAQLHLVQATSERGRFTGTLMASNDQFRLIGTSGLDALTYKTSFQKGIVRWLEPVGKGWSVESMMSVGPELQELVLADERSDALAALGIPVDLFGELPSAGVVREEAIPRWGLRHEWFKDPGGGVLGLRTGVDWTWGRQRLEYSLGIEELGLAGVSLPALYLEPTLRAGTVDFIPGVRYEGMNLGAPSGDEDTTDPRGQGVLDPRMRVVANLGTTKILGGIGLYSQPPAMRELLSPEGSALKLERAAQLSVGVEQGLGPDGKLGVTLYTNAQENLIVGRDDLFRFDRTSLVAGTHFIPFVSTGIGRSYGAELFGTYLTDERILWVALSLSRAVRRDLPSEDWHPASSDQPVNLTVIGSQALGKWRLGVRARYASGVAITPVAGAVYASDLQTWLPLYGEPFTDRAPAFFALDVRMDREWWFDRWKLSFYTEVQNATNHLNVEIPGWSEDYSQLQPVTGLPILPVLGVKASW